MSMRLPPLVQAHATIQRVAPRLLALSYAIEFLSDCLDVSKRIALPAAATKGSLPLVARIALRLNNDDLLSPALRSHWFGRAMEAAIERNDVDMVQLIHSLHPESLVINSLGLAMQHGTLEMVQWIVEHRHDRLCCSPGIKNLCAQCLLRALTSLEGHDALRVVQWLHDQGTAMTPASNDSLLSPLLGATGVLQSARLASNLHCAMIESAELVGWFAERGLITQAVAETLLNSAIRSASGRGIAVVEYLVGRGFILETEELVAALIECSCQSQSQSGVEALVASRLCDSIRGNFEYAPTQPGEPKVLQWSREYMARSENEAIPRTVLYYAIDAGHVATLRWLRGQGLALEPRNVCEAWRKAEQNMILCCQELKDMGSDRWTAYKVDSLARAGYLEAIQWVLTHTRAGCTPAAMDNAACCGHLHVVQWLHSNRTEGCTSRAMEMAAANGHLVVVKWLSENRSEHNTTLAMACAAVHGQIEVLEWLHDTQRDACLACVTRAVLQTANAGGRNKGALNGLRWLLEHPSSVDCGGSCYGRLSDPAWIGLQATTGDLELLQFLAQHHPESWPTGRERLRLSVALGEGGHLPLLQWFYAHQRSAVDWNEVRRSAVALRHTDAVAWLDSQ